MNNMNSLDEPDRRLNGNSEGVTVKLLCGADLLESFATPGLWSDEDVSAQIDVMQCLRLYTYLSANQEISGYLGWIY